MTAAVGGTLAVSLAISGGQEGSRMAMDISRGGGVEGLGKGGGIRLSFSSGYDPGGW